MGDLPITHHPNSASTPQRRLHGQPQRRMGGRRPGHRAALHSDGRNWNLERGGRRRATQLTAPAPQPKFSLHAESNQRLGGWRNSNRHASPWNTNIREPRRPHHTLLGWNTLDARCNAHNPRRANCFSTDLEFGLLFHVDQPRGSADRLLDGGRGFRKRFS